MNIFKSFTKDSWLGFLLRISIAAGGIAIGANWSNFFSPYYRPLIIFAIFGSLCANYLLGKNKQ